MKRLSEFNDERGIEVIAELLDPIYGIVSNVKNAEAKDKGLIPFAQAMLKNSAKEVMHIFAILGETKPEDFHCNAAQALQNAVKLFDDAELMELFGLQSEITTSAGSASENTEVAET